VIVDLSLSPDDPKNQDGMTILKWIRQMDEGTKGLVVTGFATPQAVRDVFKVGEAFDFVEKAESTNLAAAIRKGVALSKQAMITRPMHPNIRIKGLDPTTVEKNLGIHWYELQELFTSVVHHSIDLLEWSPNSDAQEPVARIKPDNLLSEIPWLLEHRGEAKLLERSQGSIIVVHYWDRLGERPLTFRVSRRQQVEHEYEFFSTKTAELNAMGFLKMSRPFYKGDWGAIIYINDETERTFEDFELPWPQLKILLQR
jgi:hypothetical protein